MFNLCSDAHIHELKINLKQKEANEITYSFNMMIFENRKQKEINNHKNQLQRKS